MGFENEIEGVLEGVSADALPGVQKAVAGLVEAVSKDKDFVRRRAGSHYDDPQPKGWFADPYQLLDSVGLGYRVPPNRLTFDTCKAVADRSSVISAIHALRITQFSEFARPQKNKFSVGYEVALRGETRGRPLHEEEKGTQRYISRFLQQTGAEFNYGRDNFDTFIKKITRDSLTSDAIAIEKTRSRGGELHSFAALAADSVRVVNPHAKGAPYSKDELADRVRYVQLLYQGQVGPSFTPRELAYLIRNPSTDLRTYGYGRPEIATAITLITAHLWAEQFNMNVFKQGSTVKGILNIKGSIPPQKLEELRKQWYNQISGIQNAWRTPIVNADGLDWFPLQMTNAEMGYSLWVEYLIKLLCALYLCDPAEINFDMRGSTGVQPVFMSSNEAQQKISRDRGLRPLLRLVEDGLNQHVVWELDPRFELRFVGLDAKTEKENAELRAQQASSHFTLNEVRALDDLPPVEGGDVVCNAVFAGIMQAKMTIALQKEQMQQAAQQEQQGAGAEGGGAPPSPDRPRFHEPRGEEEEQAAANILREHGPDREKDSDQKSPPARIPDEELGSLRRDDWSSSVHASIRRHDLKKSVLVALD